MAKVIAKVSGGNVAEYEVSTVAELSSKLGVPDYQATVNGDVVESDYELNDFEIVTFSAKVKGA